MFDFAGDPTASQLPYMAANDALVVLERASADWWWVRHSATNAEGFLIACAVASDVVGIIFVLLAAISLLHIKPKFSSAARDMACDTDKEAAPEINRQRSD